MKQYERFSIFLLGLTVLASGCATQPIAKDLRQQAKPVTLSQAVNNPNVHRGTVVIWGGRIINCFNNTNGASLYVLKLPLGYRQEPKTRGPASGRFIAKSTTLLDPEIYQKGHLVTVAGRLAGLQSGDIQNARYAYPVVNIKQLHLWAEPPPVYYYSPGWYGGWYSPRWQWGYWGYYRGWGATFAPFPPLAPMPVPLYRDRDWDHPGHPEGGGHFRHAHPRN